MRSIPGTITEYPAPVQAADHPSLVDKLICENDRLRQELADARDLLRRSIVAGETSAAYKPAHGGYPGEVK